MTNYRTFLETFKPIQNHIQPNGAAFDGCMFETFGQEFEYVYNQPRNHVWTVLDGDGGGLIFATGMWKFNRLGYFVTEVAWTEEENISID
jgi:hypothetical protein